MKTLKINNAAVWVLVLIHMLIGFIWFSSFMFAEKWMALINKSHSDFDPGNFSPLLIAFVNAIIMNYIMAYLFVKLNVENFFKGVFYAFLFWFAFLFVEIVTFNSFELRPYALSLIDSGKSLITFLISGLVLGSWKNYNNDNVTNETVNG